MSNIFKQFRDYQSRNVDHPSYEPLRQGILVFNPTEERRKKRNEYARQYRVKNRDRLNEYQREYRKKTHVPGGKREELVGIQKDVYDYLVKQYQKGEDLSRGAMIAKALGIKDSSVYTAIFQLVKKGYVGKGTYGRYLLLRLPEKKEHKKEITHKDIELTHQILTGRGYLDELADKINAELITQNKELYEENQKLKEQLQKINEVLEGFKSNNNE